MSEASTLSSAPRKLNDAPSRLYDESITLYGAPMSLWSGKARAYLRKQGIAFNEVMPGHPSYRENIFPQTQRGIVPVVQLQDGSILQDTMVIIDHFEQAKAKFSVYPTTPKQRMSALVLDLFGSEGLLKVAMHYRWNFLEYNETFLRSEFGDHIAPGQSPEVIKKMADKVMAPMQAYLPLLGINENTIPAIEAQYLELLSLLNNHFEQHPYLLGGQPSVADYGLFAPLYAHLSRDPYPGLLMKQHAPRLYRWVERMNAENADTPEFGECEARYLDDDAISQTLKALLALVGRDFVPEIKQAVSHVNKWLTQHPDVEGECVTEKPRLKMLAQMDYPFRGTTVTGMVIPYQLLMLQRITDFYGQLSAPEQQTMADFFEPLGLAELLTLTADRRVERANHIEVWGEFTHAP